jgi:beta-aspartyl-peptidase (threonine type)
MQTIARTIPSVGVAILAVTVGIVLAADRSTDEEVAVRKVLDDQVAAWNRGDLVTFMAGYWNSDDLTFYSGKDKRQGWKATLERYRQRYQGEGKEMGTLNFSELSVQSLGSGHALVRGRWELKLSKETVGGLFTLIFQKTKDGWKIIHDHTSS